MTTSLSDDDVQKWHKALLGDFSLCAYLLDRGIPPLILDEAEIGHDGQRYTIPIRDAAGALVNVRRYLPKAAVKMKSTTGWGSPTRLAFMSSLEKVDSPGYWAEWIVVAGGEWDALSAIAEGILAVCGTNGESSIPRTEDLGRLRDRKVAVVLDNDSAGRLAAQRWAEALHSIAADVRVVTLPSEDMDLNDWFVAGNGSAGLMRLIADTPSHGARRDPKELLDMALAKVAVGLSRHDGGVWLAAQMRDERYSPDEAWELALSDYQQAVASLKSEAYSEEEARNALSSVYARPPRNPSGRGHATADSYAFPHTEIGNAERFVARHGNDVRFIPPHGRWLVWDSQRWAEDERGTIKYWAKETVRSIRTTAFETADEDERKLQLRWAQHSESAARLEATVKIAQSEPGISMLPAEFDTDPMLLNCENGTLDLQTGKLREHDRDDYLRRKINVRFEPSATAPLFEAFLERVQPDPEVRAFLQRAVGYSLTGCTDEHKLLLLHGNGANGKSTFVELINDLLGQYAELLPANSISARNSGAIPTDIARLDGARFVSVMEFEDGADLNERLVKQLTGGDMISARFLHRDLFNFRPQCTLWISSNHRPRIKGSDDGIWRRFLIVNFPVQIAQADMDRTLRQRINKSELPGILRWAAEGAMSWQREGLNPPASVLAATEGYRADSDLLGAFLDEECTVGRTESIAIGLIYDRYVAWCGEGGLRPDSKITFGRKLQEHPRLDLSKAQRGKEKVHVWVGLGLRHHPTVRIISADNVTPINGGSTSAGQSGSDSETTDAPTDVIRRSRK